jgi:membrane-associated phospholipid phosphatase
MDPIYLASVLFEEHFLATIVLFSALALLTVRRKKIFFITMVLVLLSLPLVKDFYAINRPCASILGDCPTTYGFPSIHSAVGMVFVISALGSSSFAFFLPFGLFMVYSRIYLRFHNLDQVVGGIAFALILYCVVWAVFEKTRRK